MNDSMMKTDPPVVQADHVQKAYDDFTLDLSLQIEPNTITAVIGPNGAGKTTLFRLISGLVKADDGNLEVFETKADELPVSIKEQIGCAFADSGFNTSFTSANIENILKAFFEKDFDAAWFQDALKKMKIPFRKKIKAMSTGQAAALKVIAAMAHFPKLLILDEPTAGLDVQNRRNILNLVRDYMLTEGRTVLISSHNSADLENLCDAFLLMDEGKLVYQNTMEELNSCLLLLQTAQKPDLPADIVVLAQEPAPYGFATLVRDSDSLIRNHPEFNPQPASLDDVILMMSKHAGQEELE